jgi:hypothetical protein
MKENKETEKKEPVKSIPSEDIEKHPELSRVLEEPPKERRWRRKHYIPKQFIERLDKQIATNLILGLSIILSLGYFTFGIFGVLANFGVSESSTWKLFETTAILGWNQMRITGFVLIIIGLIMSWSVPYYLSKKTQKADSYLVIGTGIGIIFGIIYLLIVLADVIVALVTRISDGPPYQVVTFIYIPIILGVLSVPLFRILTIRHMVILPSIDEERKLTAVSAGAEFEEEPEEGKKWHFEHHQYERHRKFKHHRRDWREERRAHKRKLGRHKRRRKD